MEPQARIGLAQLTRMAFDGVDLHPLRAELLRQSFNDRDSAGALMDLSVIDQLTGNRELGLLWQSQAFETCRTFKAQASDHTKKKVLVFAAHTHIGGNTPVEFLLQGSEFDPVFYYPDVGSVSADILPDHDVAFCAAPTDAEDAEAFHATVRSLTRVSGTQTVNLPGQTVRLDRDTLADMLWGVDGLRVPASVKVARQQLTPEVRGERDDGLLAGLKGYPYVVRPVGSHAGEGLEKVETPEAFLSYLARREDPAFYVSNFEEYATDADQKYRKYRIVFVDGAPFACHMAIAEQWDVWYLNANMHLSPEKRQEEAAFMEGFDTGFALRHRAQLDAIAERIGLDYFGIDCAEDPDGNLIVFEADNALIVHDMDPETMFPYKRKPMHAIFAAFERLLLKACRASGQGPIRQDGRRALAS